MSFWFFSSLDWFLKTFQPFHSNWWSSVFSYFKQKKLLINEVLTKTSKLLVWPSFFLYVQSLFCLCVFHVIYFSDWLARRQRRWAEMRLFLGAEIVSFLSRVLLELQPVPISAYLSILWGFFQPRRPINRRRRGSLIRKTGIFFASSLCCVWSVSSFHEHQLRKTLLLLSAHLNYFIYWCLLVCKRCLLLSGLNTRPPASRLRVSPAKCCWLRLFKTCFFFLIIKNASAEWNASPHILFRVHASAQKWNPRTEAFPRIYRKWPI